MSRRTLKDGRVSLTRAHGGDGTRFQVEVRDPESGALVRAELTPEEFTNAMGGHGVATINLHNAELLGLSREGDTVEVDVSDAPHLASSDAAWVKRKLEPFERDGWFCSAPDLTNHHRRIRRGVAQVSRSRWIGKDGEPVDVQALDRGPEKLSQAIHMVVGAHRRLQAVYDHLVKLSNRGGRVGGLDWDEDLSELYEQVCELSAAVTLFNPQPFEGDDGPEAAGGRSAVGRDAPPAPPVKGGQE